MSNLSTLAMMKKHENDAVGPSKTTDFKVARETPS